MVSKRRDLQSAPLRNSLGKCNEDATFPNDYYLFYYINVLCISLDKIPLVHLEA